MRRPRTPTTGVAPRGLVPADWFEFIVAWTLRRTYRNNDHLALITIRASRGLDTHEGADSPVPPELIGLAAVVAPAIRDVDLMGECSGGTLGIVCLGVDEATAEVFAQRIADAIDGLPMPNETTFEIGAAVCPVHGSDTKRLVAHALAHPSLSVQSARAPVSPVNIVQGAHDHA